MPKHEKGFSGKVQDAAKNAYRSLRRLRLRNRDFSLISNNCIAGIIYHDLGLPFLRSQSGEVRATKKNRSFSASRS